MMSFSLFSDAGGSPGRSSTSPGADPHLDKTLVAWAALDGRQVEIVSGPLFKKDYFVKSYPHIAFKADQVFRAVITAYVDTFKSYVGDETRSEIDDFCARRELSYGLYIKGSTTTRAFQHKELDLRSDLDSKLSFSALPYEDSYIIYKNQIFYKEVAERSLRLLFEFYAPDAPLPANLGLLLDACLVFPNNAFFLMTIGGIDIIFPIPVQLKGSELQIYPSFVHENIHIKVPTNNGRINKSELFQFGSSVDFSTLQRIFSSRTIVVNNPDLMGYNGLARLAYSMSKGGWTILEVSDAASLVQGAFTQAQETRAIFERLASGAPQKRVIKGYFLDKFYNFIEKKQCEPNFALNILLNAYQVCKILFQRGDVFAAEMVQIFNQCFSHPDWQSKFPSYTQHLHRFTASLDLLIEVKTLSNHLCIFPSNQISPHLEKGCRVAGMDGREYGYFISDALSFNEVVKRWEGLERKIGIEILLLFFQNILSAQRFLDTRNSLFQPFMIRAIHQEYHTEEELKEVVEFLPEFIANWDLDPYFSYECWRSSVERFFSTHSTLLPGSSSSQLFLQMVTELPEFFSLFSLFYGVFHTPGSEDRLFKEVFLSSVFSKKIAIKNCLIKYGANLDVSHDFEFLKIMIQDAPELFSEEDFKGIHERLIKSLKLGKSFDSKQALLPFILKFAVNPKQDLAQQAFTILVQLLKDDAILAQFIEEEGIFNLSDAYLGKLALHSIEMPSLVLFQFFLEKKQVFFEPIPVLAKLKKLTESILLKKHVDYFINWGIEAYKTQESDAVDQIVYPGLKKLSIEEIAQFTKKLLELEGPLVEKWIIQVSNSTTGLSGLVHAYDEVKEYVARLKKQSKEITPQGFVCYTKILLDAIKEGKQPNLQMRYALFLLQNLGGVDQALFIQGMKVFFQSFILARKLHQIKDKEGYELICKASLEISSRQEGVVIFDALWMRECQENVLQDQSFEEMLKLSETLSNSKPFREEFLRKLHFVSRDLNEDQILTAEKIVSGSLSGLKQLIEMAKRSRVSNKIIQELYLKMFNLSETFTDQLLQLKQYLENETDRALCSQMLTRLTAHPKKPGLKEALILDLVERILRNCGDKEILLLMTFVLQLPDFKTTYLLTFLSLFIECQSKEKFSFLPDILLYLDLLSKENQEKLYVHPLFKGLAYGLFDFLSEGPFDTKLFETVYQLSTHNKIDPVQWNECYVKFIKACLLNLEPETAQILTPLKETRIKVLKDYISSNTTICDANYLTIVESVIQNTVLFSSFSDYLTNYIGPRGSKFNQKIYLTLLRKRNELKLVVKNSADKSQLETLFSNLLASEGALPPIEELIGLYESLGGVLTQVSCGALGLVCALAFAEKNAQDIDFVFKFMNTLKTLPFPEKVKKRFLTIFSHQISSAESIAQVQAVFSEALELHEILGPLKIAALAVERVKKIKMIVSEADDADLKCLDLIVSSLKPIVVKSGQTIQIAFSSGDLQFFAEQILEEAALLKTFPLSLLVKKVAGLNSAFSVIFYDELSKKYIQKVADSISLLGVDLDQIVVLEAIKKELLIERVDAFNKQKLKLPLFSLLSELTARAAIFNRAPAIPCEDTDVDQQRTLKCLEILIKMQTIINKNEHEVLSDVGSVIWMSLCQFNKEKSRELYEGRATLVAVEIISGFDELFSKCIYTQIHLDSISVFFDQLLYAMETIKKKPDIAQPLMHLLVKNIILKCSKNDIPIYNQFFAILQLIEHVRFQPHFTKEMFAKSFLAFAISYFSREKNRQKFIHDLSKPLDFITDTPQSEEIYTYHFCSWIIFCTIERICHEAQPEELKNLSMIPTLFDCFFERGFFSTPHGLERWYVCMEKIYPIINSRLDCILVHSTPAKPIDWILLIDRFVCLPNKILTQTGAIETSIARSIYTLQRNLLFRISNRSAKCSIKDLDSMNCIKSMDISTYAGLFLPLNMNPHTQIEPLYYKIEYFKILMSMILKMGSCELSADESELRRNLIFIVNAYFLTMIMQRPEETISIDRKKEILFAYKWLYPLNRENRSQLEEFLKYLMPSIADRMPPLVEVAFSEKSFDCETLEVIFDSVLMVNSEVMLYDLVQLSIKHSKPFSSSTAFQQIIVKAPKEDPRLRPATLAARLAAAFGAMGGLR
jgi:hypothetical protein